MDIIQFFYAFVLAPVIFVWIKSMVFFILNKQGISASQIFLIDTIFSTLTLYVYGFVVIHSLTKTIHLFNQKDPLYDLFEHTEYFHLWLTHILMYIGLMILFTGLAVVNVFVPFSVELTRLGFYGFVFTGFLTGLIAFMTVWLSNPHQARNFMRLMKLAFGVFFLIHAVLYFIFIPSFGKEHMMYWWSSAVFMTLVLCSLFVYKSTKAHLFVEWASDYFKHTKWGLNIQLFQEKK